MLDLLSYPVSLALMWWHDLFVLFLGGGAAWIAAVVLLVVTVRAVLLRPALSQARSKTGCLPALLQLPVFVGLSHLLWTLGSTPAGRGRFAFGPGDVHGLASLALGGVTVVVVLAVVAAVGSHLAARVQMSNSPAPSETAGRWLQRFSLWVAPAAALATDPFLGTAVLLYWATNAVCSLGQALLVRRWTAADPLPTTG